MTTNINHEQLLGIIRHHWIKYVGAALLYLFLVISSFGFFYLAGYTSRHIQALSFLLYFLASIIFLFAHHWLFLMLLTELSSCIIITDKRVIVLKHRPFIDENMKEFSLPQMKTVLARKKGFLQTVLRYGTLEFDDGGSVRLVPHPNKVARTIEQAMGMN